VPNDYTGETDMVTGFHVGYNWGVLYLSWDALAMPAGFVSTQTSSWNGDMYVSGPYAPGFLNLYDVGLLIPLRPFILYAEVGTNNLYVYHNLAGGSFGANLRLGAGLRFGFWGVNLSGTAVFGDFVTLTDTLKKLASPETSNEAISAITERLVPSINLTFYF
jgi:hypothetical protein